MTLEKNINHFSTKGRKAIHKKVHTNLHLSRNAANIVLLQSLLIDLVSSHFFEAGIRETSDLEPGLIKT